MKFTIIFPYRTKTNRYPLDVRLGDSKLLLDIYETFYNRFVRVAMPQHAATHSNALQLVGVTGINKSKCVGVSRSMLGHVTRTNPLSRRRLL